MRPANRDHPIETPVRSASLKIGKTTASKLDSVGDLGVSQCASVIGGHAQCCFEGRYSCRGVRCRSIPAPVSKSRL